MAYKRRQGISKASTFTEESIFRSPPDDNEHEDDGGYSISSSTLAAQAIRASAAHRDSSLSSAFPHPSHEFYQRYQNPNVSRKVDNPKLWKGLDALTSSLNHIGDTIGNALEEGRTIVENKAADIIQETCKLQIRRRGTNSEEQNHVSSLNSQWQQSSRQTNHEDRLKASRDVAMATSAKAKLLLRELKTVKADLAFAILRCSQLEEENKILRESCEKGDNPADDDMIRLQLETLLAEKGRLAHENSVYARENRFLREIVEYHQLTMQDVVYLDEGIEEVTLVFPVSRMLCTSPPSPASPISRSPSLPLQDVSQNEATPTSAGEHLTSQ